MKTNCSNCGNKNPKQGMKTCSRKCADEMKKKNSREKRCCLFCKTEFEVRKKDERQLCSDECRKSWAITPENKIIREKIFRDSIKSKYGVENVFELKSMQEKVRQVKFEKYGNKNYNNSKKHTETMIEKYGDDYGKKWYQNMSDKIMKNHGASHPLQVEIYLNKLKSTNLEKYGTEWALQNVDIKRKFDDLIRERFGVDNISQSEEIKQKKKDTSMINFGVSHHLKDYDLFQKHLKSQYKVFEYKNTGIYYQGSYEKYFLELIEEKGLINEVLSGQSYEYSWENEIHIYHTDFYFRGKNIEIKSNWTYNNNGKNIKLQELNEIKWESVKSSNEVIVVLIGKEEIKGFIKAL